MAINLGDVNFRLGADDSALASSVRKLQAFGTAVDQASASTAKGASTIAKQFQRQEQAAADSLRAVQKLNSTLRQTPAGVAQVDKVNSAYIKFNDTMTGGVLGANTFRRAKLELNSAIGEVTRTTTKATTATEGFGGMLRRASQQAVLISGPLGGVSTRLSTLASVAESANAGTAALFAGVAIGTVAFGALGVKVVSVGRDFERYEKALAGITGSQDIAKGEMAEAIKIADRTGTAISDVIPAYTKLTAATKNTSLQGTKTREMFEGVAKVAGQLQLPVEQTTGVFKAMEQMVSKGVVQSEELRGQMGDRLPGAFQIAARAMNMTTEELSAMMKKGKLSSEEFLPKFVEELERTYGVDSISRIDNFGAALNRVNNAFVMLYAKLNEVTQASSKIKTVFDVIATTVNWVTDNLATLGKMAVLVATALAGTITSVVINGAWMLGAAIGKLVISMFALNTATMLPGLVGMVNIIGLVVGATFLFHTELNNVISVTDRMQAAMIGLGASITGVLVVSMGLAMTATGGLTAAFVLLRAAMIRTGWLALAVLVGEAVYQFTKLVEACGSVSEAFAMVGDIFSEVWDRIILKTSSLSISFSIVGAKIEAIWAGVMSRLITKYADFLAAVAGGLGGKIGTALGLDGVADNLMGSSIEARGLASAMDHRVANMDAQVKNMQLAKDTMDALANAPLTSVTAIQDMLNKPSTVTPPQTPTLPVLPDGTAGATPFGSSDGGKGKADKASKSLEKYNDEITKIQQNLTLLGEPTATFEALERSMKIEDTVKGFAKDMLEAGMAIDVVKAKSEQLKSLLEKQDVMQDWSERTMAGAKAVQESVGGSIDTMVTGIGTALMEWSSVWDAMGDAAETAAKDIINTLMQLTITNPLKNLLFGSNEATLGNGVGGGLFGTLASLLTGGATSANVSSSASTSVASRNGNAFNGGGLIKMAKGGLLSRPTIMKSATGNVLGGEAGSEAIMPLQRDSAGRLGVMNIAGSSDRGNSRRNGDTFVSVHTDQGAQVKESRRTDASGNQFVDLIINTVKQATAEGKLDKTLGSAYGVRRQTLTR